MGPFPRDELQGPIGRLDAEAMREVVRAIGYVIDAECEPS